VRQRQLRQDFQVLRPASQHGPRQGNP
jgi:hypothetical protein